MVGEVFDNRGGRTTKQHSSRRTCTIKGEERQKLRGGVGKKGFSEKFREESSCTSRMEGRRKGGPKGETTRERGEPRHSIIGKKPLTFQKSRSELEGTSRGGTGKGPAG